MEISYAEPSNTLLIQMKKDNLVQFVKSKLSKIVNIVNMKDDLELLKYTCLIIENKIYKKKYKDKICVKEIVFLVYTNLFGNQVSQTKISTEIDFLYENELIKVSSLLYKIYTILKIIASNKK